MRVKIKDTWYDSNREAICIQVNKGEKEQIYNNPGESQKYAIFPDIDALTKEQKFDWMKG